MSTPPPPYQHQPQYQPPQQPYGAPQAYQQQYGAPQAPQQYGAPKAPQQYGAPQPPRGPQRPQQRSPLQALLTVVVVLAIFGGGAWYVWDYNTNPNGGKAKAEASQSAQAEENKTHDPKVGDCIKVEGSQEDPLPVIVECGSAEAEYKMGERNFGADAKCGPQYVYVMHYSSKYTRYTMCFTKA
ncbi:hypothetical protein [Streptomyces sp. NPDC017993]|uniref:LppU/SCO3897 family protein n=1 Tax=Streptomyces sp. NPDC017993 TaxID=3365027 RepID=UPI003799CD3B